jgi:hypothetical protein
VAHDARMCVGVGEKRLDAHSEMCRCACACCVRGRCARVSRVGLRQSEAREMLALLKVLPGDVVADHFEALA